MMRGISLRTLNPAAFAIVMATGIISIAADLAGLGLLGRALFWLNTGLFAGLWLLYGARLARCAGEAWKDFLDPERSPGYLTLVAGTCVFGSQLGLFTPWGGGAAGLWLLALALWVPLGNGFLAVVFLYRPKAQLLERAGGAWLLLAVSTQALAGLGSETAAAFGAWMRPVLLASLALHLLGDLLYLLIVIPVIYRLVFIPLEPAGLSPADWICMGAAAISALAAASLVLAGGQWGFLAGLLPALQAEGLLWWAAASGWIIPLLLLGFWRHRARRYPLAYETAYWGMVFPLGMYSAATSELGRALGLEFLRNIGFAWLFVALAAWGLCLAGMLFPGSPSQAPRPPG